MYFEYNSLKNYLQHSLHNGGFQLLNKVKKLSPVMSVALSGICCSPPLPLQLHYLDPSPLSVPQFPMAEAGRLRRSVM